jgi:hypothetical protein
MWTGVLEFQVTKLSEFPPRHHYTQTTHAASSLAGRHICGSFHGDKAATA